MKKKQSSIEFAIEKITQFMTEENDFELGLIAEKLKAMHKEEVEMAYVNGQQVNSKSLSDLMIIENAESYYIETFGGDNE